MVTKAGKAKRASAAAPKKAGAEKKQSNAKQEVYIVTTREDNNNSGYYSGVAPRFNIDGVFLAKEDANSRVRELVREHPFMGFKLPQDGPCSDWEELRAEESVQDGLLTVVVAPAFDMDDGEGCITEFTITAKAQTAKGKKRQ